MIQERIDWWVKQITEAKGKLFYLEDLEERQQIFEKLQHTEWYAAIGYHQSQVKMWVTTSKWDTLRVNSINDVGCETFEFYQSSFNWKSLPVMGKHSTSVNNDYSIF